MASYPIQIRRCRHIRTNGTQCGSPALKQKELCYYHEQNRPTPVELYLEGDRYADGQIILPVFEDAHSLQTVIRQVVQLMLSKRIERKDAGLLLYALQIASGNLKTMQAEKARPTQVVVDPEHASDTPLGMTPWSTRGEGHDVEGGSDSVAERVLEEASQRWEERYRKSRDWPVEWQGWIDELLRKNPAPTLEDATNQLWRLKHDLDDGAKLMAMNLAPGKG